MSGRAGAKGARGTVRSKKAGSRWAALGPSARRWVFIGGFTLALLVGLPLAHALVGDIGAILLGTFALGFVVGRMTLKR
jgi:hypothetical protein